MANAKEIQKHIKSVQDTMKITNAMYMISSAKLRTAKQRLENTEPYFYSLQMAFNRFLRHAEDKESIYFKDLSEIPKDKRRVGYIVVTADKGLAGSYNHNVIKLAHRLFAEGGENKLFVVGELGRQYFAREGLSVDTQFHFTAQNPTLHRARIIAERVVELYQHNEIDEVYIIYTKMENAFRMETEVLQLLPLKRESFQKHEQTAVAGVMQEELAFDEPLCEILNHMVPNYVMGFVYGALVESFASEQNSRMMAMESSTKSAKKMLGLLSMEYNRVRQAAITQEITEVIGGAKSLKNKDEG